MCAMRKKCERLNNRDLIPFYYVYILHDISCIEDLYIM